MSNVSRRGQSAKHFLISLVMVVTVASFLPASLPAVRAQSGLQALPQAVGVSFESEFNGTKPGWTPVTGSWGIASESYLRSVGLPTNTASIERKDTYTDFIYQARMKRTGCATCAQRLIIRGNPDHLVANWWAPSYVFEYFNEGKYDVIYMSSAGSAVALMSKTSSSAINAGEAWNRVKVRAVGSSLKLYFNSTLVWSGTSTSLTDGQVGIAFHRSTADAGRLLVDWARLTVISTADALNPFAEAIASLPIELE